MPSTHAVHHGSTTPIRATFGTIAARSTSSAWSASTECIDDAEVPKMRFELGALPLHYYDSKTGAHVDSTAISLRPRPSLSPTNMAASAGVLSSYPHDHETGEEISNVDLRRSLAAVDEEDFPDNTSELSVIPLQYPDPTASEWYPAFDLTGFILNPVTGTYRRPHPLVFSALPRERSLSPHSAKSSRPSTPPADSAATEDAGAPDSVSEYSIQIFDPLTDRWDPVANGASGQAAIQIKPLGPLAIAGVAAPSQNSSRPTVAGLGPVTTQPGPSEGVTSEQVAPDGQLRCWWGGCTAVVAEGAILHHIFHEAHTADATRAGVCRWHACNQPTRRMRQHVRQSHFGAYACAVCLVRFPKAAARDTHAAGARCLARCMNCSVRFAVPDDAHAHCASQVCRGKVRPFARRMPQAREHALGGRAHCLWNGCGADVPVGGLRAHVTDAHGGEIKWEMEAAQPCRWEGCRSDVRQMRVHVHRHIRDLTANK